MTSFYHNF